MIFSSKDFFRSGVFASSIASFAACATAQQSPANAIAQSEIRVMSASLGTTPTAGAVTRTTVYESPRTVTQVLRLAPGGRIAEHHHPSYDETFLVEQGHLTLSLNGKSYDLGAGDFVVMPAGTVVSGSNVGDQEARVVVAFSNTGSSGPLSVAGSPHH